MKDRLFDLDTAVVIGITLLLFIVALFEKGFTHEEAEHSTPRERRRRGGRRRAHAR